MLSNRLAFAALGVACVAAAAGGSYLATRQNAVPVPAVAAVAAPVENSAVPVAAAKPPARDDDVVAEERNDAPPPAAMPNTDDTRMPIRARRPGEAATRPRHDCPSRARAVPLSSQQIARHDAPPPVNRPAPDVSDPATPMPSAPVTAPADPPPQAATMP